MSETLPGIEVGDGHALEEFSHAGGGFCGFVEWHRKPDSEEMCGGTVNCCSEHPGRDGQHWTVTGTLAGGDLTLAPSLQCTACPSHGTIVAGKWVPA